MDYSKYIEMKMKAANTYKSNWQARDASEVTLRKVFIGQNTSNGSITASSSRLHNGPIISCPSSGLSSQSPIEPVGPGNGFSTDYTQDCVMGRVAGNIVNNDTAWGNSGGVTLIGCDQVAKILAIPANPVPGTPASNLRYTVCGPNPAILQKGYVEGMPVPYTGTYNNVRTNGRGVAVVYPPYPSG
jgi:hypothetical protein